MMNNLQDFFKNIQTEKKIQSLNEEATKQSIILKILQLLEWDVFDVNEVSPEFSVENTRVDYALRKSAISKVFIEVKRINEDLEKHQEQLLNYSFKAGVNLSILTNGILWWFYLPLQEGSWEQRKFYTIDMYSQESEKIAEIFYEFLAREKVFNGEALKNAKKFYGNKQKKEIIKRNIPSAWRKLHIEGDELFIELIAETTEKICGFRPQDIQVSEFLYSIIKQDEFRETIDSSKKHKSIELSKSESNIILSNNEIFSLNNNFTSRKPTGFIFLNEDIKISSWLQLYIKILEKIYLENKTDFKKITKITGKKRPYFTNNKNELRRPKKISNSEFFAETNLSANFIISIIKEVLRIFNYNENDVGIKLKKN